jgi:hypothetical protein
MLDVSLMPQRGIPSMSLAEPSHGGSLRSTRPRPPMTGRAAARTRCAESNRKSRDGCLGVGARFAIGMMIAAQGKRRQQSTLLSLAIYRPCSDCVLSTSNCTSSM